MHNLRILYLYEVKKIVQKKMFWITLVLCMLGIIVSVLSGLFGTVYVDGKAVETNYQMFLTDKEYRQRLSGRPINQELLQEMQEGYRQIPVGTEEYFISEEYQMYARPYSDIFNIVRFWTGMNAASVVKWEVDEAAFYEARRTSLEEEWQQLFLTEQEKEFWREKEKLLQEPLTYYYHEGYGILLYALLTMGVLVQLFVSICLSGVFPEEHNRRTEQLILSSRHGKNTIYWAKSLAGISVSFFCTMLMVVMAVALTFGIYGSEGFEMAMQIFFRSYSYPISIGEACLIAYGILLVVSVLAGVFVMVLSEVLHSSVAALAISAGLIISGMIVVIPEEYRIFSQIWNYLPMSFMAIWNVFDARPITLFGRCITAWQIVPLFYILSGIALIFGGKKIYQRYQVTGR